MATKGKKINNPITGEEVEFIETAKETDGKSSKLKVTIKTGGGFKVEHYHTAGEEIFEVISGILTYKLEGKIQKLTAGNSVVMPRKKPHSHYNEDIQDLVMYQTITPSLDIDLFLETLFGLAADNKLNKAGQPLFLQIMVWIRKNQSKTYLATIPKPVQDVLAFVLSPIANFLGYKPFYEKYTTN